MKKQRIDYKKKMKNRNRRTFLKRTSTLTLATTLALSVPVTSLSLNVSGTQIAGVQTAFAQGGNLLNDVSGGNIYILNSDREADRASIVLGTHGSLNVNPDDINQDLYFTVQVSDGLSSFFGTDEFYSDLRYSNPSALNIKDSDGNSVTTTASFKPEELEFNNESNSFSFNFTKYLENNNYTYSPDTSANNNISIVVTFPIPVKEYGGTHEFKTALTEGKIADLNSVSGLANSSFDVDPDALWPEEPGDEDQDPELPEDEDQDPELPEDEDQDPELPEDEDQDPELPEDEDQDPELPEDEDQDPELPEDEDQDPELPEDEDQDPELPEDEDQVPELPEDEDQDPELPEDEDQDPESGSPEPDPEDTEPPVYANRSLIDFTTEYELIYEEELNFGSLTLTQIAEEQVGLDFDQVDDLTYTLQFPEELGHILDSEIVEEVGFFGAFNVPLVDEDGDYVFYEIEDLEDFQQFVSTDFDTNSIHVEVSKWADSLGYEITDEEYLYSQAVNLIFDLDGVEGVHTLATAYTDGKLDLGTLDNEANLIEVDFDSGESLPDGGEPIPQPEPQPDGDDDKDDVVPPGKDDDKKDGDKSKDKKKEYKKDKSKDKKEGGALPKTATNDLAYALAGLSALLLGLAAKFSSRFRKT